MAATVKLRAPVKDDTSQDFVAPSLDFLSGTWWITHSTLPMWKSKHNVHVKYTPIQDAASGASESNSNTPESSMVKLNDEVVYQQGSKTKTVAGVDAPSGPGAWHWRGNGWLRIATSSWLLLGYGGKFGGGGLEQSWAVTYFQKTIFTPAGIDIYSREKGGLNEELLESIKKALAHHESELIRTLAAELFEVARD